MAVGNAAPCRPDAVRTWALVGTVVLYLAINGGGYDLIVRSQVAIVVWWIVLIGAAWGLFPAVRWTRTAWIGAGSVGGFVVVDRTVRHVV